MTTLPLPALFAVDDVLVRTATVEAVDVETGIVEAKLAAYETEAELDEGLAEVFTRHAFAGAVGNPSRVKVSNQGHDRRTIVGQARELRDEDDGLYGRLKIVETTAGRDLLMLMREGVLTDLSVEFKPQRRYMKATRRGTDAILVRHDRATLVGVSPVPAGAYGDAARVLSVREAARDRQRERIIAGLAALTSGPERG